MIGLGGTVDSLGMLIGTDLEVECMLSLSCFVLFGRRIGAQHVLIRLKSAMPTTATTAMWAIIKLAISKIDTTPMAM